MSQVENKVKGVYWVTEWINVSIWLKTSINKKGKWDLDKWMDSVTISQDSNGTVHGIAQYLESWNVLCKIFFCA